MNKAVEQSKGIHLLPNIFTTGNLFVGFYSIIASVLGRYELAAVAILIGGLFDSLDGKIARWTHTTSRFGVEYDSLSDLVTFGMAPAILSFLWALQPFRRIGWLAAFLFVVAGAFRLARFNANVEVVDKKYFVGLPIPAGAGVIEGIRHRKSIDVLDIDDEDVVKE
jgi:CDP-diacylglycerol--serine O-phosphatidyltransferase